MSENTLKGRINEAMKAAMRARDKDRLGAIRLIQSEIKRIEVDERIDVDDARLITILDKMQKQRKDSISQFESAGRQDLADKESAELLVIQEFLPAALDEAELNRLIGEAITQAGAESIKDMGKVMGILKPQVQGRADMGQVSQAIKAKLA